MIESFVKSKTKKDKEDQDYIELDGEHVADLLFKFALPIKKKKTGLYAS